MSGFLNKYVFWFFTHKFHCIVDTTVHSVHKLFQSWIFIGWNEFIADIVECIGLIMYWLTVLYFSGVDHVQHWGVSQVLMHHMNVQNKKVLICIAVHPSRPFRAFDESVLVAISYGVRRPSVLLVYNSDFWAFIHTGSELFFFVCLLYAIISSLVLLTDLMFWNLVVMSIYSYIKSWGLRSLIRPIIPLELN